MVMTMGCTIVAAVLTAASPLLKRISQVKETYLYNTNLIYFLIEVLKLVLATIIYSTGRKGDFCLVLASGEQQRRFALAAFMFFVQNNLGFAALLYFNASSFQLLMSLRLVMAAAFSVTLFSKLPSCLQCCAIIMLCTGCVQHFLLMSSNDEPLSEASMIGLTSMLATVATSALANECNQLVVQADREQPLMLQNIFLYLYGVVFNAVNWARSTFYEGNPALGEITTAVVLLVLFTAIHGLYFAAVPQHLSTTAHGMLGILAIVVTIIVEFAFFRLVPSFTVTLTFFVILLSAHVFSLERF